MKGRRWVEEGPCCAGLLPGVDVSEERADLGCEGSECRDVVPPSALLVALALALAFPPALPLRGCECGAEVPVRHGRKDTGAVQPLRGDPLKAHPHPEQGVCPRLKRALKP